MLGNSDCVIGPASDGGYYLIGLSRFIPKLFQNIDWGTEKVLKQTLAAYDLHIATHPGLRPPLRRRGAFKIPSIGGVPERRGGSPGLSRNRISIVKCSKPTLLPMLDDVDLPTDIPLKISVIIPTLNEASTILPTLGKVKEGFGVEVIVVDGGSTDETQELVPDCLRCAGGRAMQQNAGAAAATGEILLFLHADTELPENWDFIIRSEMKKSWVSLGAFRFGVKERLRGIGAVEWGTNIRSRFLRMPYGDQGLFLRRDTFESMGGFPNQPIMEDVALVRRARRVGKIVTVQETALTSGRRWRKRGVFWTTCINQLILLGAALGVPPQKLRRLYG